MYIQEKKQQQQQKSVETEEKYANISSIYSQNDCFSCSSVNQ